VRPPPRLNAVACPQRPAARRATRAACLHTACLHTACLHTACLNTGCGVLSGTHAAVADGARRRRAVDITLHEYLLNSTRRQRDPEKASIFFMPVYLARLFNWFWTRQHCKSEADSPLTCMKEPDVRPPRAPLLARARGLPSAPPSLVALLLLAHARPSAGRGARRRRAGAERDRRARAAQVDPWWDQHWVGAQNATSNVVRAAIKHISHKYPYWNRTNGADHFLVYSYDRGARPQAPPTRPPSRTAAGTGRARNARGRAGALTRRRAQGAATWARAWRCRRWASRSR